MRRHGVAARRRAHAILIDAEKAIVKAMWAARVHREARRGARVVAGPLGEVLVVESVSPDGYGVSTSTTSLSVQPDVLKRVGLRWVEDDLKKPNPPKIAPIRKSNQRYTMAEIRRSFDATRSRMQE